MEYKGVPAMNMENLKKDDGDIHQEDESSPAINVNLDPIYNFQELQRIVSEWNDESIIRALIIFKVAILQNRDALPPEIYELGVSEFLVSLAPPRFSPSVLEESIRTSCAWTGVQNVDLAPYCDDEYFKNIYNYAIENSASESTMRAFAAALCLIKNITYDVPEKSNQLIAMHAFKIFSFLYYELRSNDLRTILVQIIKNALRNDEVPLEYGHYVIDMYLPVFRSSLDSLDVLDIETIHLFCLTGTNYTRYFMDKVGPSRFFQVYETGSVDVRIAILKMWLEFTECPDEDVSYSALFVPWNSFVRALKFNESNEELELICQLLMKALEFGEDPQHNVVESKILYALLTIVEKGKLSMKKTSIKLLTLLVENNTKLVINYIVDNKHIGTVIDILYLDDWVGVEFALRLLIKIVSMPYNPRQMFSIAQQLTDAEFDEVENELFEDSDFDTGEMYEDFVDRAKGFLEECPEEMPEEELEETYIGEEEEEEIEEEEINEEVIDEISSELAKFLQWKREKDMKEKLAAEEAAKKEHEEIEAYEEEEDDGFEDC